MSEVKLRPHELHVKHKATQQKMIINKSRFNENEYEKLAEGKEGTDGVAVQTFDAPSSPPSVGEGAEVDKEKGVTTKTKGKGGAAKNKAEAPVPPVEQTPPPAQQQAPATPADAMKAGAKK